MPLDATYLLAAALMLVGVGLVVWNLKVYRAASAAIPAAADAHDEHDFLRRQLRRRLQASTMMLILGPAVLGGELVKSSLYSIFYWGLVLLIVFWMGVLSLADILATQYHYSRQRESQILELARMKADLENVARQPVDKEKRPGDRRRAQTE